MSDLFSILPPPVNTKETETEKEDQNEQSTNGQETYVSNALVQTNQALMVRKSGNELTLGESISDFVSKQTRNQGQIKIYSSYQDTLQTNFRSDELERPSLEEEQETIRRTREALSQRLEKRVGTMNAKLSVKNVQNAQSGPKTTYIRYTPYQTTGLTDVNSEQRKSVGLDQLKKQNSSFELIEKQKIVRIQEVPDDPFEPPRFDQKRAPMISKDPFVPILHDKDKPITEEEKEMWNIQPCISMWKNKKGYTIPLDKRLAADGRGLQQTKINDRHAKNSEALYIAERNSREEVEKRNQLQIARALKLRREQDKRIREFAKLSREKRTKILDEISNKAQTDNSFAEREKLRSKRDYERKKELKQNQKFRGNSERDISEKIALDMNYSQLGVNKDIEYDTRLLNMNNDSRNFNNEEQDNVYSTKLFNKTGSNIFRPSQSSTNNNNYDTTKFTATKEFHGVNREQITGPRDKPIQFEKGEEEFMGEISKGKKENKKSKEKSKRHEKKKDKEEEHANENENEKEKEDPLANSLNDGPIMLNRQKTTFTKEKPQKKVEEIDDDLFGFNKFMTETRGGNKRNALSHIGGSGHMSALSSGGVSSGFSSKKYLAMDSSRKRSNGIQFVPSKETETPYNYEIQNENIISNNSKNNENLLQEQKRFRNANEKQIPKSPKRLENSNHARYDSSARENEKDRESSRYRERTRDRERGRDREREMDRDRDRNRDKYRERGKERERDRGRDRDRDRERGRDRDRHRHRDERSHRRRDHSSRHSHRK
ncbi:nuclear protein skip-related [Anaeramoeba flamelloides]|uniref:Nuclear protein skip-related n=1 Tax=Anaeramoeba flamelloides TaxID=1746091 RepID=A0AAV7Y841_9EUKA|nr:nuclear protein skip-related [Anaeramoeba flamelloides]